MGKKTIVKKPKRKSKRSHLQDKLIAALQATDLPMPVEEHKFHPTRKWRFDAAWPTFSLAVELQGGTYAYGRHSRGPQMHNDYDKLNAAQLLGWRVFYFDSKHIKDMEATLDTIRQALELKAGEVIVNA